MFPLRLCHRVCNALQKVGWRFFDVSYFVLKKVALLKDDLGTLAQLRVGMHLTQLTRLEACLPSNPRSWILKVAMDPLPQPIISKNPATGEILAELTPTAVHDLPAFFDRARQASEAWSARSLKKRARALLDLREVLLDSSDDCVDVIHQENGKPRFEALANEVFPCVDALTYLAKNGRRLLGDRDIPMALMKHRRSLINYWPLGTVAIISPWNYPLLLPFTQIASAVMAGNAVIFKPSEVTPLVGLKIQALFEKIDFPDHLVQTVIGDGTLGAAIIENRPNKIFFTGSVPTGKRVMAAASKYLIPVNLELGGKDPMIVMADANLDFATSAALWGGFSNAGQVCASTERLILHESISLEFLTLLRQKISQLQVGRDLGPATFEKQKAVYSDQISQARKAGAEFIEGGDFDPTGRFLKPTLVTGDQIEQLPIYTDETFGPVIAVTTFKTVDEAVRKANATRYGLLASIITKNRRLGEQIARRLEAGTVIINEVTYTGGLAETPWGGVKESGIGRTHGEAGLYEFVNMRHIHRPRSGFFVFKSPWWFPYSDDQYALFKSAMGFFRRSWLDRLRALPETLFALVRFIKSGRRI